MVKPSVFRRQMARPTSTGVEYIRPLPALIPNPPIPEHIQLSRWTQARKKRSRDINRALLAATTRTNQGPQRQHSPKISRNKRRTLGHKSRAKRHGHLRVGPRRHQHSEPASGTAMTQSSRDEQPRGPSPGRGSRSQAEHGQPRVAQNTSGDANISASDPQTREANGQRPDEQLPHDPTETAALAPPDLTQSNPTLHRTRISPADQSKVLKKCVNKFSLLFNRENSLVQRTALFWETVYGALSERLQGRFDPKSKLRNDVGRWTRHHRLGQASGRLKPPPRQRREPVKWLDRWHHIWCFKDVFDVLDRLRMLGSDTTALEATIVKNAFMVANEEYSGSDSDTESEAESEPASGQATLSASYGIMGGGISADKPLQSVELGIPSPSRSPSPPIQSNNVSCWVYEAEGGGTHFRRMRAETGAMSQTQSRSAHEKRGTPHDEIRDTGGLATNKRYKHDKVRHPGPMAPGPGIKDNLTRGRRQSVMGREDVREVGLSEDYPIVVDDSSDESCSSEDMAMTDQAVDKPGKHKNGNRKDTRAIQEPTPQPEEKKHKKRNKSRMRDLSDDETALRCKTEHLTNKTPNRNTEEMSSLSKARKKKAKKEREKKKEKKREKKKEKKREKKKEKKRKKRREANARRL